MNELRVAKQLVTHTDVLLWSNPVEKEIFYFEELQYLKRIQDGVTDQRRQKWKVLRPSGECISVRLVKQGSADMWHTEGRKYRDYSK
jgi:hypothetical protein